MAGAGESSAARGVVAEVEDLWKTYDGSTWVLRGISFAVSPGEFLLIVGDNGSGKTTLLKIIAGLLKPTRGRVMVCGRPPTDIEAKRCMGVVLHGTMLYDELTVRENLELYAALSGTSLKSIELSMKMLGLDERMNQAAGWLSYGWRRRADTARALLGRPRLLLIDEPLSGLDPASSERTLSILVGLAKAGAAIIATSPRRDSALESVATRVALLSDGKIVWEDRG
ncbi:MAG: ABC transporter ATP-binding protein [Thermoproteota archaeon]